jgi:hypothetical protein
VSHDDTVSALLDVAGTTYAEETGINVADSPQALYRLLVMSTLLAARINASIAIKAARGMSKAGYRSAERMADAAWRDRVAVLHDAGYTRYQERTASMLAGRDPAAERKLLKQFKGMGDVGVDVFFREVQAVWDELRPFFDERARAGAARLGLPKDPAKLAELVPAADLTRLSAALVRVELDDDVRDQVRSRRG